MDDTTMSMALFFMFFTIIFLWTTGLVAFFVFQYMKMRHNIYVTDKATSIFMGIGSLISTALFFNIILPEFQRNQNRQH